MLKFVHNFERIIITSIIIMMMVTILISTVELGVILMREFLKEPKYLLDLSNLLEIFGFFFMLLIGLELLHTIKNYLIEESMHVEIVFLVAMIAMARKIIVLDFKSLNPIALIAIALIVAALAGGYYLVKQIHPKNSRNTQDSEHSFKIH